MKRREVLVSKLLVDQENPRLPEVQDSQRNAIRLMASLQEKKIIVLADHIISHGINLSDLPIIIEAKDEADRYSVLDGNRRLTALRGLETPNLVKGAISNRNFKKLKDLSKKYLKEPIETIWTVQADTREEADPWIKLRHRGESGGAGLVEWDGEAGARYDKRRGEATPHLDLLNFVLDKGNLRDNIKSSIKSSFPITTLERLVRDPDIRTFTGIDVRKGIVYTRLPDDEVLKPWEKIITELAKGTTTVSDVKVKEDRLKYIGDFDKGQLPDQSKSGSTRKLGQDPGEGEEETNDKKKKKNKKKTKPSLSRDSLIPKETSLHISEKKINDVYLELQSLHVEPFNNVTGVMMRVFMEWSIDHYIKRNGLESNLTDKQKRSIHKRVLFLVDHIDKEGLMDSADIKPIRVEANNVDSLISFDTLHSYVHSHNHIPKPSELLATWDRLEPLIITIWSE